MYEFNVIHILCIEKFGNSYTMTRVPMSGDINRLLQQGIIKRATVHPRASSAKTQERQIKSSRLCNKNKTRRLRSVVRVN